MKALYFLLLFSMCFIRVYSQSTLPLRADTVVIEKVGGNANLRLKDASRDSIGGIYVNIGGGVLRSIKTKHLNDTTYVIGVDTIRFRSSGNSVTISNVGTGYRWVKSATGQIKTVDGNNTIVWDSTTNGLSARVDTSYIATQSDLKDTAAAIRATINSLVVITTSNAGSGFRWVKTPTGAIKTAIYAYGINGDSTTNTDAITLNADTTELITPSRLRDTAAAIRASSGGGGSQNLDQVLTVGNTTSREIISTADIQGDSAKYNGFHLKRSGKIGSFSATRQALSAWGSSITFGSNADTSYPLAMSSHRLYVTVTNNAVPGSRITSGATNNLHDKISTFPYYNSSTYGFVFDAGINDWFAGVDTNTYKAQLGEIIDSLILIHNFPSNKVLVLSPPYSPTRLGDSIYVGINARVVAAHGGVAIDIFHLLQTRYTHGETDVVSGDSLHMSNKGNELIALYVSDYANMGDYIGHLSIDGSDTVYMDRTTYGNNITFGKIIPYGVITQPAQNGAIKLLNPGKTNGSYQDLRFIPDNVYHTGSIKDSFFFRHTIANSYQSTFSFYRRSDNTNFRAWHLNENVQLLLGTDAPTPPTLDYGSSLGVTYMTSALIANNLKIEGDANGDAQRLRVYKNSGGLDVAAVGYNATYGLMIGTSTTPGTNIGDYSSVDGTTFTPVMKFPHNNLYNVLIGGTTDNTVGKLQITGKITVSTHSLGSNSDSALTWDRSTNEYKYSKINAGSTPSWESVMTTGANFSTAHTSAFSTNAWTITTSQSSTAGVNINNTGNGSALSATTDGTGSAASISNSSSGAGAAISSSSGFGANITSTTGLPLRIKATPSSTNTVVTTFRGIRGSSSTMAIGGGNAWDMQLTDDAGNDITTTRFSTVFTDATTASPDANFNILTITNGSLTNKFTIKPTSQLQLNGYGSGTFTGTVTNFLAVTSDGSIVETSSATGTLALINDADHTVTGTESAIRYHNNITTARTVTLPDPSAATNREIWVKWNTINGGASLNITTTSGTALIYLDGGSSSATYNVSTSFQSALLKSDGTSWYKIN